MTDDPLDGANDGLFLKVVRHFLRTPAPRRGAVEAGEPAETGGSSPREKDD